MGILLEYSPSAHARWKEAAHLREAVCCVRYLVQPALPDQRDEAGAVGLASEELLRPQMAASALASPVPRLLYCRHPGIFCRQPDAALDLPSAHLCIAGCAGDAGHSAGRAELGGRAGPAGVIRRNAAARLYRAALLFCLVHG